MENKGFSAGFDRTDVTPKNPGIPLAGFGATSYRLATSVLDPISLTTVAVGCGKEPEVLLLTFDWINVTDGDRDDFRSIISEATGIPEERILIGGTHTHSGPDIYSPLDSIRIYKEYVRSVIGDAAKRAVSDLKPAKIFYGRGLAGREGAWLNYCKHYKMAPVEKKDSWTEADLVDAGDNYGSEYSRDREHWFYVRHEEEADHEVQLIEFRREEGGNILLLNFQAHAMLTGVLKEPDGVRSRRMSSDFPGVVVKILERTFPGTHAAFYQGAAGNLNPNSRMESERIYGLQNEAFDAEAYSSVLAAYVRRIRNAGLTESETDTVGFRKHILTGICNHTEDHRVEEAKIVRKFFDDIGHHTPEVYEICRAHGFNSPYHAGSVIGKAALPETLPIELNAVRFGDVGFVTAPCEMFNANQLFIKEHSPFKLTFVKAYSCGRNSYIPSANTCMNSYERNCTRFVPGTGEQIADALVQELTALHAI